MKTPLNELGLNDAVRGIRNGSFSSEELVMACLERIQQREKSVGAWIYLDEDQALEQARKCDRTKPEGPLHGIPVGIKDILDTRDMPTCYGSPIYEGHQPVNDSSCVSFLRNAER